MTKSSTYRKNLTERMHAAFAARDPQAAADIICEATTSSDEHAAMIAASGAGFVPEYYGAGIRVHLPAAPKAPRTITRINRALKAAGRDERLVRNLRGGSYYYLTGGTVTCSIYCYSLDPQDYNLAAIDINAAFRGAGLPPPCPIDHVNFGI